MIPCIKKNNEKVNASLTEMMLPHSVILGGSSYLDELYVEYCLQACLQANPIQTISQ